MFVVDNPIKNMYDKYINKYGGRIVGISKKDVQLENGQYYDVKYYEIFREDFINKFKMIHRCKSIINKMNKL